MEIVSKNEEETYDFAKKVASKIGDGSVLALIGDLGSGKTTFTKGLAKTLGIKNHITSPTFVLMKEYTSPRFEGMFSHVDCYRFHSEDDARSIGLMEKFENESGVVVLEWADRIMEVLPKRTVKIYFESVDNAKKIKVKGL